MKMRGLLLIAALVGCGGAEPPKAANEGNAPPRLPPSMGGGATPATSGSSQPAQDGPAPSAEVAKAL